VLAANARLFDLKYHSIPFNDRFESTLVTMCRAFFNEERVYNRRKRTRAERSPEASDIGAPTKVQKEDSTLRRQSAGQPKQTGRETPVLPTVVAPLGNDTEQPTGLSDNVDAMDWRATMIKMEVSQERHKSSLRGPFMIEDDDDEDEISATLLDGVRDTVQVNDAVAEPPMTDPTLQGNAEHRPGGNEVIGRPPARRSLTNLGNNRLERVTDLQDNTGPADGESHLEKKPQEREDMSSEKERLKQSARSAKENANSLRHAAEELKTTSRMADDLATHARKNANEAHRKAIAAAEEAAERSEEFTQFLELRIS
jgi:hypothetical protein